MITVPNSPVVTAFPFLSNLTEKKYINLKYVVYDIETLKNCFTCCFLDYASKKKKEFVIHNSRNDFKDFIKFLIKLKQNNYYFVGFNNLFFENYPRFI